MKAISWQGGESCLGVLSMSRSLVQIDFPCTQLKKGGESCLDVIDLVHLLAGWRGAGPEVAPVILYSLYVLLALRLLSLVLLLLCVGYYHIVTCYVLHLTYMVMCVICVTSTI